MNSNHQEDTMNPTLNPVAKFIEDGIERFGSFDAFASALISHVAQKNGGQR